MLIWPDDIELNNVAYIPCYFIIQGLHLGVDLAEFMAMANSGNTVDHRLLYLKAGTEGLFEFSGKVDNFMKKSLRISYLNTDDKATLIKGTTSLIYIS